MYQSLKSPHGFTLVEVLVSLILTSLAFTIFLQALNTGKSVRQKSELRTKQRVILNSLENQNLMMLMIFIYILKPQYPKIQALDLIFLYIILQLN